MHINTINEGNNTPVIAHQLLRSVFGAFWGVNIPMLLNRELMGYLAPAIAMELDPKTGK